MYLFTNSLHTQYFSILVFYLRLSRENAVLSRVLLSSAETIHRCPWCRNRVCSYRGEQREGCVCVVVLGYYYLLTPTSKLNLIFFSSRFSVRIGNSRQPRGKCEVPLVSRAVGVSAGDAGILASVDWGRQAPAPVRHRL